MQTFMFYTRLGTNMAVNEWTIEQVHAWIAAETPSHLNAQRLIRAYNEQVARG